MWIRGMGLTLVPAPLHKVVLCSDLVNGEVALGVWPALPVDGVQVILGNYVAGTYIWAGSQPFVVTHAHEIEDKVDPQIFPACAVTRAQACLNKNEVEVKKEEKVPLIAVLPLPAFPFSVSRSDFIQEQQNDPNLFEVFQQVRPVAEMESVAHGYFLEDGMLVRKWLPQGDGFVGDAKFQIVVPTKLRDGILGTAHEMVVRHLGVKRSYDKIFRYFYWPHLKKDISVYIKTCHTCQLAEKKESVN